MQKIEHQNCEIGRGADCLAITGGLNAVLPEEYRVSHELWSMYPTLLLSDDETLKDKENCVPLLKDARYPLEIMAMEFQPDRREQILQNSILLDHGCDRWNDMDESEQMLVAHTLADQRNLVWSATHRFCDWRDAVRPYTNEIVNVLEGAEAADAYEWNWRPAVQLGVFAVLFFGAVVVWAATGGVI